MRSTCCRPKRCATTFSLLSYVPCLGRAIPHASSSASSSDVVAVCREIANDGQASNLYQSFPIGTRSSVPRRLSRFRKQVMHLQPKSRSFDMGYLRAHLEKKPGRSCESH